jgi:hypothetical protein
MALKLADRVKVSTATTGTGAVTLGSAVAGFRTFAQGGVANGETVRYVIEDGTAWEIGSGVYTASGTTMTRVVDASSAGGTTAISLSGSATVYITATAADIAAQTEVSIYTTVGTTTWTKPFGAKWVEVIVDGDGGGGGGGRWNTSGAAAFGGGGGAAGARTIASFPASALPDTVTVTVGGGGLGGAGRTTATNGVGGTAGSGSSFGDFATASGGNGGNGGSPTAGPGGTSTATNNQGLFPGTAGGGSSITATAAAGAAGVAATGGGGGGGVDASGVRRGGGNGGNVISSGVTGGTAALDQNGGNGGSLGADLGQAGAGGAGGSGSAATVGTNGGNGGLYGGGGGGGGGAVSPATQSGSGGNGGQGIVIVTVRY